ncbi:hypothetical protein [Carnobacterium maltaromaticum]|uniref:hypothetical protein n=2 Tax=Carnobacterium maltaromaticum TaxID=2751 RepID=UPI0039BE7528
MLSISVFTILILLILILTFWVALYLAAFLKILNSKLALTIILLEVKSFIQPKIKIIAFLIMMNEEIKANLEAIASASDNELLKEYRKKEKYKKISIAEVKEIKRKSNELLKKGKSEELISFDEVKDILYTAGLLNFLFSIKRSVQRYSSFEQQEKFAEKPYEADANQTFKSLISNEFLKQKKSFPKLRRLYTQDSFSSLKESATESYLEMILFS